ncbi:hypothetical protein NSA47_01555 [Irregularibacter muris]|uniref:Uncharacterized protein n=1 Tax=Irregularibacter muris TaxID=1796619 RepID=A0AAE3KZ50_9FIRM|nr:hypothetical protein [Irregularibacter muris]MCR1897677.1 hypothetical protein [Irregularibacter muris]
MFSRRSLLHRYALEDLRELGCTVDEIDNNIVYVKYYIHPESNPDTQFKLKYTYHRDNHGGFFIDRIRPYSLPLGRFETEEEIVKFILKDIELFSNAVNSNNFPEFVELGNRIETFKHSFESFFLHKNVETGDLRNISNEILSIIERIEALSKKRKDIIIEEE